MRPELRTCCLFARLAAVGALAGCTSYGGTEELMVSTATRKTFCYQVPVGAVRDALVVYLEKYYGEPMSSTAQTAANPPIDLKSGARILEEDRDGTHQLALSGASGVAFVAVLSGRTDACLSEARLYGKSSPWNGRFYEIDAQVHALSD